MSRVLINQLKKLNIIKDDNDYSIIHIPKKTNIPIIEDRTYIIELSDNVFLSNYRKDVINNFNNGVLPKSKYYKANITRIYNDMIKINGISYDYENKKDLFDFWTGWLLLEDVNILEELHA